MSLSTLPPELRQRIYEYLTKDVLAVLSVTLPPELVFRILEYYADSPQARLYHSRQAFCWTFWFEDGPGKEIRLSLLGVCRPRRTDLISVLSTTFHICTG